MPEKNDYVNYGSSGICRIEDIRFMQFDSRRSGQDYYVLRPVYQEHANVFVPVNNPTLTARMRPVLTPEEVDRVIYSVKGQELPWIADRKARSARFREILLRRDEGELLLLIACLRKKDRENSKGLSASDAQVLKLAEGMIQQEFSFSLNISAQSIGSYIRSRLGSTESIGA